MNNFHFRLIIFVTFLFIFIFPFFYPGTYKASVYLEFLIIAPILLLFSLNYNSAEDIFHTVLLILTLLQVFIGVPGSQFGYLCSAVIGLVMGNRIANRRPEFSIYSFRILVSISFFYLFASFYLIYVNFFKGFSIEQIAQYFVTASMNYVSLTIAAFCVIFVQWALWLQIKGILDQRKIKKLRILALILSMTVLGVSLIFSTRSVIFTFLPLLLFYIQPKKPVRFILITTLLCIVAYFSFSGFTEFIIDLIVPGRENLIDLYESEIKGQERSESFMTILNVAIPNFSFCTECTDYLSFSGLANLIGLSFPFSIFYIIIGIVFAAKLILKFLAFRINLLMVIVALCFLSSLLVTIMQADFLSVASLFFTVRIGTLLLYDDILQIKLTKTNFQN